MIIRIKFRSRGLRKIGVRVKFCASRISLFPCARKNLAGVASLVTFSERKWGRIYLLSRQFSFPPLIIPYPLYESQVVVKRIIQTSIAGPEFHLFAFGKRNVDAVV